jgi:hypothetical protein
MDGVKEGLVSARTRAIDRPAFSKGCFWHETRTEPFDQVMEFEAFSGEIVDTNQACRTEPARDLVRVESDTIPIISR